MRLGMQKSRHCFVLKSSGKRLGLMSFANEGISFAIQYSPVHTAFDQFLTSYMKDNDCPEYIAKIKLIQVSQPDIQLQTMVFHCRK